MAVQLSKEFFENFKPVYRKPPVFENGICKHYSFNPCFKPIFKGDYRFLIYYGGRAGEKSYGITDSLIQLARNKKTDILCAREVQKSIKDSIYKLWKERINYFGYNDFRLYDDRIINTVTKSTVIFKGMNDINDKGTQALKGLESIDIVHFDEAQTASKNTLDVLIPTIRKKGSKLIFSLNPLYDDDYIMDFINNPRPRSYIKKLYFYENPFVSDETIEDAKFYFLKKPDEFRHIFLGETQKLHALTICKYFNEENIKDIKYIDDMDVYLSCDFNVATMAWAIAHITNGKVFCFDEIANVDKPSTTTVECIREFIERYRKHKGNIIVTGDKSGYNANTQSPVHNYEQIRDELEKVFGSKRVKIKVRTGTSKANPPVQTRIDKFNALIYDGNNRRFFVNREKCPIIYHAIKSVKYNDDGRGIYEFTEKDFAVNSLNKFACHMFDAVSYIPCNIAELGMAI